MTSLFHDLIGYLATLDALDLIIYLGLGAAMLLGCWLVWQMRARRKQERDARKWQSRSDLRSRGA